ncbi:hypothetical protein HDU84_004663 [Entophlyctis sp. JEL0112]|nr:hypothetical protein HDU84_004663 [Entophlyctis sp. JEL0112]
MPDDWNADTGTFMSRLLPHLCQRSNLLLSPCVHAFVHLTEWNDILREKGIIPEKEITEEQLIELVDETMEKKYGLVAGGEKLLEACSLDELNELEDEIDLDQDDRILEQYRKQRMAELHQLAKREIYGSVVQISKPDWQTEVTNASKNVPVTLIIYKDGDILANLVGIQALGGANVRAYDLERMLVGYKVIESALLATDGRVKGDDDEDEDHEDSTRPFSGIRISRNGGARKMADQDDDGWD